MVKVLPCRFHKSLGSFTVLHVEGSCEKGSFLTFLWARLSQSTIFEIYKLWGSSFFQNVRNLIYISKRQKNIRIVFSFLDICIWIGRVNLSLLGREYLSLVVNVLTNSRKIFCIAKRDFFQLNSIHSDQ